MPKTIVEKLFSSKAGQDLCSGDTAFVPVDFCMSNDASGALTIEFLERMGVEQIAYPDRIAFIIDHYVPCPDVKVGKLQQSIYDFASRHGIQVVPAGEGIAHQVFDELGNIKPGALIVGGDSHTTTYGYLNCLAMGMGASDMAMAMYSGSLWFKVPETIRVNFSGVIKPNISGKDVALYLLRLLGGNGANYRAVEFGGDGMASLSMDDRRVICNMLAESCAKCGVMPFDQTALEYCVARELDYASPASPDPGCSYLQTLNIDLTEISHLIAIPHSPAYSVELEELAGLPVDMVLIGTCTNGRLSDFEAVHELLSHHGGRFVTETLVIPGSRAIYLKLVERGIAGELLRRGAMILPPGCGPCCGSSPGVPRDGFTVLSTANRNFLGRMGNTTAKIYLSSPLVAAASALTGKVTDPKEVMRHTTV
ncbi:MAG: 3-isopropylmalate dehydratase/homoaconitate hydratase family large subunit [Oscillospiraceae bacterium]|nr:3-isopropylmalate dehydratase/homoaconitate hydratase family large subunit [Oscillospiraceae bacterium]